MKRLEKHEKNKIATFKRKRWETLKDYVRRNLPGWELVSSSSDHDKSDAMSYLRFELKPVKKVVPGEVTYDDNCSIKGHVSPANMEELKSILRRRRQN